MNPFLAAVDPVAVRQGRKLLGDLPALPMPPGSPFGVVGQQVGARSLTVIGDEFCASGLSSWDASLPGLLASRIGQQQDVVWQAVLDEGCTIRQVHQEVLARLPQQLDMVVLWVGWADVIARTPVDEWRRELDATVRILARTGTVVIVGCPPVRSMPRLRQPLTAVLASRADAFDEESADVAAAHGATFVGHFEGGDGFQSDGVHLSAAGMLAVADRVGAMLWP